MIVLPPWIIQQVVAGPWLGEFGWELFRFQGVLRALADKGHNVTVVSRSGHQFLYEDFATEFVPITEFGFDGVGETEGDKLNGQRHTLSREHRSQFGRHTYLSATQVQRMARNPGAQHFIRYQAPLPVDRADVVVHARMTNKADSSVRNWSPDKWNELIGLLTSAGMAVHAIGSTTAAICPQGAIDMRGVDIKTSVGLLSHAAVAVGPSSGPMHLASLSGCPHVVWTDNQFWPTIKGTNRQRYESIWNPLNTPAHVIDEYGWEPPVEAVHQLVRSCLD